MYCTYRQGKHNAAQLRNGYDYVATTVCMQFVQLIVRQIGREKGRECEKAREYGRKGRGGQRTRGSESIDNQLRYTLYYYDEFACQM